jgi:hypothetical protein
MKPTIPFENQEPQFPEEILLQGVRPYISLVVVGFIIYAQTLSFGFIHSDDDILILKNFPFISNISNFFNAFKTDVFVGGSFVGYYRPLMTVSLMIDALFCKARPVPFIFHLSNILMHLLVACLTYLFFVKITQAKKISYLFAVLFTVHPVLTQAVGPISGRNDTLLVLFALTSFLFFLSFLETRKGSYLFWHFVFFGLALFTKETAFVLLVLYPLYLYLIRKERIGLLPGGVFVAGWAAIVVFWFLLREAAFTLPQEYSFVYIARSILSNSSAVLLYIGKITFPFNLSVAPILQDSTLWYGIIATIAIVVLLIISGSRRFNYILFGFLWFLLSLVPILIAVTPHFSS